MDKTSIQLEKWKDGQDKCTAWEIDEQNKRTTWEMERWTRPRYNLGNGKMDKTTVQLEKWKDGQHNCGQTTNWAQQKTWTPTYSTKLKLNSGHVCVPVALPS